jgi:adenosylcobinamide kinase/adenosylcobinamide-phosphate guanylyltransferase
MAAINFVFGGASSGKSEFAEKLLRYHRHVAYVATMERMGDAEVDARIAMHAQRRPPAWGTFEAPHAMESILKQIPSNFSAIIIDCMTIYLSNRFFVLGDTAESAILDELNSILKTLETFPQEIVLVAQEIGLGVIPATKSGRKFRELSGKANQRMARIARNVWFVAAGLNSKLK